MCCSWLKCLRQDQRRGFIAHCSLCQLIYLHDCHRMPVFINTGPTRGFFTVFVSNTVWNNRCLQNAYLRCRRQTRSADFLFKTGRQKRNSCTSPLIILRPKPIWLGPGFARCSLTVVSPDRLYLYIIPLMHVCIAISLEFWDMQMFS